MRYFFLLTLAVLTPCARLQAQQMPTRGLVVPNNLEFISQQLEHGKGIRHNANAKGTPMLSDSWTLGRVHIQQTTYASVWLKYNLVTNQLLWRRPAGDSLELNTAQITEFSLGDSLLGKRAAFRRYLTARIEAPELRTRFFEVRYDAGHAALLRLRTKQLSSSSGNSPSLNEASPPWWTESTQYYVKRTDNTVVPVRLTEKALLEALGPEHAPELTAYAKQAKLSLKKEADVVRLITYYDTL